MADCKYATKGFRRRDHLDRHIGAVHPVRTPPPMMYMAPAQPMQMS
jgi:hypothetical protein